MMAVFFLLSPNLCLQEVEYNVLEEQLQKTLSDLEKREKQLAEAELEVRLPADTLHNTEIIYTVYK